SYGCCNLSQITKMSDVCRGNNDNPVRTSRERGSKPFSRDLGADAAPKIVLSGATDGTISDVGWARLGPLAFGSLHDLRQFRLGCYERTDSVPGTGEPKSAYKASFFQFT